MAGIISGQCRKCGYRIDGIPANEDSTCTCPECGFIQWNPALRHSAPSLKGEIGLVLVLSSVVPVLFGLSGVTGDGMARAGNTILGLLVSPIVGAVLGLFVGSRTARRQRRSDYIVTKGKAASTCLLVGLLTSLGAMVVISVILWLG